MAESFDAYHLWLGIAPEQQPPNHYRLLGLNLFEDSAEVIDNAADRQMAHLKTVAAGKHAERSQRLLNEISAARVCLQDAGRKSVYDEKLKASLESSVGEAKPLRQAVPIAPLVPPTQAPVAQTHADGAPTVAEATSPVSVVTEDSARPRRKSFVGPLLLAATVLVGLGVTGYVLWSLIGEEPPLADSSNEPTDGNDTPTPDSPSPDKSTDPDDGKTTPDKLDPGVKPVRPKVDPVQPKVDPIQPKVGPEPTPKVLPEKKAKPKKHPVPSEAALKTAEAEVNEVFADEPIETPEQKLRRAVTLRATARETDGDPAAQYAMFRMSALLSAEQIDLRQADRAIDEMHKRFDVNALALRAECFKLATEQVMLLAKRRKLAGQGIKLVDKALAADDFDVAVQLVKVLRRELPRVRDKDLAKSVAERRKRGGELFAQFKLARDGLKKLDDDPDDADANLSVGKYYCFSKGDWPRGLPLLAKGSDELIKKAAVADLTPPASGDDRLAVADAWFTVSQTDATLKQPCLARAAAWYSRAVRHLRGLTQARAKKQLEDIQAMKLPKEMLRSATVFRRVSPVQRVVEPVPSVALPTRGLVGHWKFDAGRGAVARDSAAKRSGKIVGCQWDEGVMGKGLRLDGKGYVEFGPYDFGDQFTIALWAKPTQKKSCIVLIGNKSSSFDTGFEMSLNTYETENRRLWLQSSNGTRGNKGVGSDTASFEWGKWSHFVVTVDHKAHTAHTYVNAKDTSGSGKLHPDFKTLGRWRLGARMKGNFSYVGFVDELRVYNRVLTAEEVAALAKPPAAAPPIEHKAVELMPRVELAKHATAGKWAKTMDGLLVLPHKPAAVLLMPVQVDGPYNFSFEFSRTTSLGRIGATIPVGLRQTTLVLSDGNGAYHGLGPIDGKYAKENVTKVSSGELANRRRHRVDIHVRPRAETVKIDVWLDGKQIIAYSGKLSSLGKHSELGVDQQRQPALFATNANAVFHRATIKLAQPGE